MRKVYKEAINDLRKEVAILKQPVYSNGQLLTRYMDILGIEEEPYQVKVLRLARMDCSPVHDCTGLCQWRVRPFYEVEHDGKTEYVAHHQLK